MSSSKKALEQLHEIVANDLATIIRVGVPVKDETTGEVHRAPAPAQFFTNAIKFLNDNGVRCDPTKNKAVQNLVTGLPFEGLSLDDEDDHPQH